MPHTSRVWILKCPLQSWALLNVSQASEYPPSRSSCRQSAWPPLPPKRGHMHQRCINNHPVIRHYCCLDFFSKSCFIHPAISPPDLPIMSCLSLPAMNMEAFCSLGLFGSLAVMGSSDGAVKGIVR